MSTNGIKFEKKIQFLLRSKLNYDIYLFNDWVKKGQPIPAIIKYHPYKDFMGNSKKLDFVVKHRSMADWLIEVKTQSHNGSFYEKIPYVVSMGKDKFGFEGNCKAFFVYEGFQDLKYVGENLVRYLESTRCDTFSAFNVAQFTEYVRKYKKSNRVLERQCYSLTKASN